jgi:hypothetical protein
MQSNTIEARRALRQDLELQNINLAKKFLAEFDNVRHNIEGVEMQVFVPPYLLLGGISYAFIT